MDARAVTQLMVGLMLLFGAVTLLAGGIMRLRAPRGCSDRQRPRAALYIVLALAAAGLSGACFILAWGALMR